MFNARLKNVAGFLLLAIGMQCSIPRAQAWSAPGHMVIAAEAYRNLTPALQQRVTEILKAHPQYNEWNGTFAKWGNGLDLPVFIFMRASTWPDEISRGPESEKKYDHPHWHYVDYPLKPPAFPMAAEPAPDDDVLFGINECEKFLGNTNTLPKEKAVYLSYLIHLVGDLHQPLHCCSLVNATYPKGDRGGNDFYVKPELKGIRLHAFWDGLLGTRPREKLQYDDAIRIDAEHSKISLREMVKDTTPKSWSLEGRQIAIDSAYLRGNLLGSTNAESAPPLPEGYTKAAKVIGEKQAALAGYRLADEITNHVK